jgi:hypothetical protein
MNSDVQAARDDLAFVRRLVEGGANGHRQFGEVYLAAGLAYGGQLVGHWLNATGALPLSQTGFALLAFGPTAVFLLAMTLILVRHRRAGAPNLVNRAISSVFGCVGIANIALIASIGSVAVRHQSLTIWLVYPAVILILQGAAWLVAAVLRRRLWQAAVAIGWFATAIAMALTIDDLATYCLIAAIGFFAFMAAPGAIMMRVAKTAP